MVGNSEGQGVIDLATLAKSSPAVPPEIRQRILADWPD
jgi:hypothetical protein